MDDDHGRRGDAGPDRRLPGRAAARRARRRTRSPAAPRRCASTSSASGRSRTTSSTRSARAATARTRGTSRPRRRSSPRRRGRASRSTATARPRRRPARRTCSRRSGSSSSSRRERIERSIDELGFGFLFAQAHHPAMRHAAPVRRELAHAYRLQRARPARRTPPARGRRSSACTRRSSRGRSPRRSSSSTRRRAYVVHGAGGIDELSPAGRTSSARWRRARCASTSSTRSSSGRALRPATGFAAATRRRTRAALRDVLERRRPAAHRSAVLLNAAGAIAAAGHAADLREGLALARAAIDSGAAATRLDELIAFSRSDGARLRDGRVANARGTRPMRFSAALASPGSARSPSSSAARPRPAISGPTAMSPRSRARYEQAGARAISVLVDERFAGSLGRPARRPRGDLAAAARQGLLLHRRAAADGGRGRRRRGAAAPARPRRRDRALR